MKVMKMKIMMTKLTNRITKWNNSSITIINKSILQILTILLIKMLLKCHK